MWKSLCPAKDIICKNGNYKGLFAKLSIANNKRSSVIIVNDSVNTENCKYVPLEDSWSKNQETWRVFNIWNENGKCGDEDYSVLSVRTIYDQNGLE